MSTGRNAILANCHSCRRNTTSAAYFSPVDGDHPLPAALEHFIANINKLNGQFINFYGMLKYDRDLYLISSAQREVDWVEIGRYCFKRLIVRDCIEVVSFSARFFFTPVG